MLKFLFRIEDYLKAGSKVHISFAKSNALHPCGMLLFCAFLDIWFSRYAHLLSCDYPEDDVVEQLFQHVGVFDRFGLTARKVVTHEMVKFWHFHSGNEVVPATYKDLAQSVIDHIDLDMASRRLFADCLNEAVTNTVGHAYRFPTSWAPEAELQKWWMFSQVKDGFLFVAIYDRGVSIPGSLRRKPELKERLRGLRGKDSYLIEAAVKSPRTTSLLLHRGKGLPEMLEFCQLLNDGSLTILSGQGAFAFDAKQVAFKRHRYDDALPGTLVLWRIPLAEEHYG